MLNILKNNLVKVLISFKALISLLDFNFVILPLIYGHLGVAKSILEFCLSGGLVSDKFSLDLVGYFYVIADTHAQFSYC